MKNRRTRIVVGVVISAALIFAGFTMYRSSARDAKIESMKKVLEDYCVQLERTWELADFERITDLAREVDNSAGMWNDSDAELVRDIFWTCSNAAYDRLVPTTTTAAEPSEAEAVAEGRTCSLQWNYAHSETVSGWDQDVQLRGTLYACASVEDWTTQAINKGEWSEFLLVATCALEAGAPKRICG